MTENALFSPLVERAIELAAEWHDGTYRKGRWREAAFEPPPEAALRIPVMAHVTMVALTVQRAGWPDEVVAAAFLHDVLEDDNQHSQAMRPEELAALVGEEVTHLVVHVTEPKRAPDGTVLPWRTRKEAYIQALATGPDGSAAISLADKLHNAWSMNESLRTGIDIFASGPGRRALSAGHAEQRWFFEAVLDATRSHTDPRLPPMRRRLRAEIDRFRIVRGRMERPE